MAAFKKVEANGMDDKVGLGGGVVEGGWKVGGRSAAALGVWSVGSTSQPIFQAAGKMKRST